VFRKNLNNAMSCARAHADRATTSWLFGQVTFAEYNSSGPGANPSHRVRWSRQLSAADMEQRFTVSRVLHGWVPSSQTEQV
jgi:hypothetical protein